MPLSLPPCPLLPPLYLQKTLEKDFMLEPKDLGPNLKETIKYVLTASYKRYVRALTKAAGGWMARAGVCVHRGLRWVDGMG